MGTITSTKHHSKALLISKSSESTLLRQRYTQPERVKMPWFKSETRHKKKYFKQNGGLILEQKLKSKNRSGEEARRTTIYSSDELKTATDNYTTVLGGGTDGTVFKGTLPDGTEVAVKKSEIETDKEDDVKGFINEIITLSQVENRNIVKLLGCCLETPVPHLVYEFVSRGDLARRLREKSSGDGDEFSLTWEVRLRIGVEVAGALAYMHSSDSFHMFHRDVKSANILLDQRYRAKLADFGISRSVGLNETHVTTATTGTNGYLDPEFAQSRHYTDKSDVYSFGVVLVELLTGRIGTDMIQVPGGSVRSLGTHFVKSVESNRLWGIIDGGVKREEDRAAIEAVAELAKKCLYASGRQRPTMKQVGEELERIRLLPSN